MTDIRHSLLILALAFFAFGCATVPPYQRPPAGATEAQRRTIYIEKRVDYDFWTGYTIGGTFPGIHSINPASGFSDYYEASGNSASAARVRQTASYNWAGLATGAAGIVAMIAMTPPGARTIPSNALLVGVAGLGAEVAIISWGRRRHFEPAAESFNRYLRQDLGLPDDEAGLTSTAAASGQAETLSPTPTVPQRALYGFFGSGWSLVSTYDLADYYLIPGASTAANSWPWTDTGVPQLTLGTGYVAPNGATLELRFDMQARGQYGRFYDLPDGSSTPAWANNTVGLALGLVPGYTLTLSRLPKQRSVDLFLGCELGLGYLMSKGTKGDSAGTELGTYYLRSPTFSGGPLLRLRLPFPYGDHWGLGFELGYRLEKFTNIHVADSYGVFAGRPSPDRTMRGTESVVDLSGPFFNVTVLFGRLQFSK